MKESFQPPDLKTGMTLWHFQSQRTTLRYQFNLDSAMRSNLYTAKTIIFFTLNALVAKMRQHLLLSVDYHAWEINKFEAIVIDDT